METVMSKSWFVRADYTVYANNIEEAITKWMKNVDMVALQGDVVFDGLQEVFENEWSDDE
jgi:hypothetical protein